MNQDGFQHDLPKGERNRYKRPFDLFLLIISHVLLLPALILLWTLIPLMIWLGDRGPIFFSQKRAGKGGVAFILLKFRTMRPEAQSMGPFWTTDGDTRITAVGKLLRKTALDELPGIISIWKGDMSFVGPRALDIREQALLEQSIEGFEKRLQVIPGLTGLAQVYDSFDKADVKLGYDLEYIEHMSIRLDIKLLFVSIKNTLLGKWDSRGGKSGISD